MDEKFIGERELKMQEAFKASDTGSNKTILARGCNAYI